MDQATVLIIESQELVRLGLVVLLNQYAAEFTVIGQSDSGQGGMTLAIQEAPTLVILNAHVKDMANLDLLQAFGQHVPSASVVVLDRSLDDTVLYNAVRFGAHAYHTLSESNDKLLEVLRHVRRGAYPINDVVIMMLQTSALLRTLYPTLPDKVDDATKVHDSPLTPRERRILTAIAHGNSNKEIAHLEGLSDQVVKNSVSTIMRKLAVNGRTLAVTYALRQGWIDI